MRLRALLLAISVTATLAACTDPTASDVDTGQAKVELDKEFQLLVDCAHLRRGTKSQGDEIEDVFLATSLRESDADAVPKCKQELTTAATGPATGAAE